MTRMRRKALAHVCLFALLFLQLAVAAYACPVQAANAIMPDAARMADVPCSGDMDQPKLCAEHHVSDSSASKVHADPLPVPSGSPLLAPITHVRIGGALDAPARHTHLTSAVGPPIPIRLCVLRL